MYISKVKIMTAACVFGLLHAGIVSAEELNLRGRSPTTEEVIQALKPSADSDAGEKVRTRSINIRPKSGSVGSDASAGKAISLEVRFGFNSAQLTDEAVRQLTPVAAALVSGDLRQLHFHVEGYTDAKGSEEYNMNLSKKRAAAVRDFFVIDHGLEPSRIQFFGHGESNLLDPANPYSAANRRVRIVAIQ